MHKLWRFCAALLAFFALASIVRPTPLPPRRAAGLIAYTATPVPLNPGDPAQRDLGPLRFVGGWALSSADRRLGGISAMHVADGQVTALSDAGDILRFPAPAEPDGFTLEIRGSAHVAPLVQGPGSPERKVDRDTEAMVQDGEVAWIAFEHHNQVWRYRAPGWQAEARATPAAMADWPGPRGAEAMARLPGGRFLIMSESLDRDGTSPALLFAGDPAEAATPAVPVRFRPPAGYRITDVAALPDGRLFLVTRRMSWPFVFEVKLLVGRLPDAPGGEIATQEIAAMAPPLTAENYEAVSIVEENGRTIIWLASDDNTTPLQRTLLMKFEWIGDAAP